MLGIFGDRRLLDLPYCAVVEKSASNAGKLSPDAVLLRLDAMQLRLEQVKFTLHEFKLCHWVRKSSLKVGKSSPEIGKLRLRARELRLELVKLSPEAGSAFKAAAVADNGRSNALCSFAFQEKFSPSSFSIRWICLSTSLNIADSWTER